MDHEKVNILLVDDQPAKLLAYEVILKELGENLVIASSGLCLYVSARVVNCDLTPIAFKRSRPAVVNNESVHLYRWRRIKPVFVAPSVFASSLGR